MARDEQRPIRIILIASFGMSVALSYILLWQDAPLWAGVVLGFIAVIVCALLVTRHVRSKSPIIGWLLLIAFANLLFVVPELALRASGFRFESGIQFGYPRPSDFVAFEPDEELFWRLRFPQPDVNSRGFPGEEFETKKADDVFRILFLGDSVTQQGYPKNAEVLLNSGLTEDGRRVESIMLAVSGYSSHQGRVLAETYADELEPDAVVVYFGWNDHWQAYGAVDSEKQVIVDKRPFARNLDRLRRSVRLLQAVQWVGASLSGGGSGPSGKQRVPIDTYGENLLAIRDAFADRDVPVVFITAPTTIYRSGVPDFLVDQNFLADKPSGLQLHSAYNDVVRGVNGPGVHVLDLEREFGDVSDESLNSIFMTDSIHLTPAGSAAVATRVAEVLQPYVNTAQ